MTVDTSPLHETLLSEFRSDCYGSSTQSLAAIEARNQHLLQSPDLPFDIVLNTEPVHAASGPIPGRNL